MIREYLSGEKWAYAFYTVTHPMDGFYEIRHRGRGSVPVAVILAILFSVSFTVNRISASFVVNDVDPRSVSMLWELGAVLLLFFLLCVSNWSITCLMNGEGRLKDIVTVLGYSLIPAIIGLNIGTVFSQAVASDEEAFYYMIVVIGIAYTVMLVLMGCMTVHNYTLGKTLLTFLLTFIALLIIIFVALLFFDLITQVYSFLRSIYQELIFRN